MATESNHLVSGFGPVRVWLAVVLIAGIGCERQSPASSGSRSDADRPTLFHEIAEAAGLDFEQRSGEADQSTIVEVKSTVGTEDPPEQTVGDGWHGEDVEMRCSQGLDGCPHRLIGWLVGSFSRGRCCALRWLR